MKEWLPVERTSPGIEGKRKEEGAAERISYGLTVALTLHPPCCGAGEGRGVRNEGVKLSLGRRKESVCVAGEGVLVCLYFSPSNSIFN